MIVLREADWRALAAEHRERVRRWTGPHLTRRRAGQSHPVLDFLFTYYSTRPAQLERWHPGAGVVLGGASAGAYLEVPGYVRDEGRGGVRLEITTLPERLTRTARFVEELLGATGSRKARLGCFGLHEWAMVYRSAEVRHGQVPLRLGAAGTDAVVEQLPVHCTHHDAYRFFTDAARPLNAVAPSRADQVTMEQPGCLHANMDLYKWATKIVPVAPSTLVADCFELAVDIRHLDMAASPYDLRAYGTEPVPIETAEGRATYARAQADFAGRAAGLRERMVEVCRTVLG